MKWLLILTTVLAGTTAAFASDRPNVLLICIDDLRPELACFGADYIHSPNIDAIAERGRAFHRHYVQAPTCGASRYALLTGKYGPPGNGALFGRAQKIAEDEAVTPSLPTWFRQHGYTSVSVGKVSHHPGGRGGADWDDSSKPEMPGSWDRHLLPSGPWQHPRGAMHGLAHGEIREDANEMAVFQLAEGGDEIYPDGLIKNEALRQLDSLSENEEKPFFLAVGIIRPHLPFGAPQKYMEPYRMADLPPTPHPVKPEGKTTWHGSGEFRRYHLWDRDPNTDAEFAVEVRKHYAACVSFADALTGQIMDRLDDLALRDNTIVVVWGDHGWHLGEHAIWGKHSLFEESLRSPLIVSYKDLPQPGEATDSVVETIDLFPTLCELAGLPKPDFLQGTSLLPQLNDPEAAGHPAIAYRGNARTIRTDSHRLIVHDDGALELYDHRTEEAETKNLAETDPATVERLRRILGERLP